MVPRKQGGIAEGREKNTPHFKEFYLAAFRLLPVVRCEMCCPRRAGGKGDGRLTLLVIFGESGSSVRESSFPTSEAP